MHTHMHSMPRRKPYERRTRETYTYIKHTAYSITAYGVRPHICNNRSVWFRTRARVTSLRSICQRSSVLARCWPPAHATDKQWNSMRKGARQQKIYVYVSYTMARVGNKQCCMNGNIGKKKNKTKYKCAAFEPMRCPCVCMYV